MPVYHIYFILRSLYGNYLHINSSHMEAKKSAGGVVQQSDAVYGIVV